MIFFWIALIFYNRLSFKRNEWAVIVAEVPDTAESQEAREYDELDFFMQTVFYLVGGHSKSQSDFIPICQRSVEKILRSAAALELRAIASMSISDIDIDTWLSRSMSRKDRRETKIWKQ